MRKRKVYHLLALLSPSDQERFSLYLASPYFNSSPTLVLFWDLWRQKVLAVETEEDISEQDFVAGSTVRLSRIDALCWELMVKVREFLSLQSLQQSPELESVMFARAILERDVGLHAYGRFVPQLEKDLAAFPESPDKQLAILLHKSETSRARIFARKTETDWQGEFAEMHRALEEYALIKGLQWSCGAVNANHIFRQSEDLPAADLYQRFLVHAEEDQEHLLAGLYRLCLTLLLGLEGAETFPRILRILESHREEIAEDVRNDIFNYVLNYCIRQINQGNAVFLERTFELYLLLLKYGDLLQHGQISPQQFKNTVALACRLRRLDWVRGFIDTYHPLLSDTHEGLALQYNEAVLLFHQAEYAEAIRRFRDVIQHPVDDVFYGLDARAYLWKSYFEHLDHLKPDEVDEMYRLYDSLRLYVNRNDKISPVHQSQYRNFVRLFKRFMKCLENPDREARRAALRVFSKKLQATDGVANKTWFSQKVDEALQRA